MTGPGIDPVQRAYSREADPEHYAWQTRDSYFAATEAELLAGLELSPADRLLEMGCGEGGNLYHLRDRGRLRVGIDASAKKAAFAARHANARALVADAAALPFGEASFDAVLIRDLLHHVRDRGRVLAEARRVLRHGGKLLLIEPNARSPLILLQAALIPAERGVLASTGKRLESELLQAGFTIESQGAQQPLPLGRVLTHPRLPTQGAPIGALLSRLDAAAACLMPRRAWMYLLFRAVKP
jgi:SAM-dependent methyltransferase